MQQKKFQDSRKYISFFSLKVASIKIIFSSLYGCKPYNYASFRRFSQLLKFAIELRTQKVREFLKLSMYICVYDLLLKRV
jgi:hypothetical protein